MTSREHQQLASVIRYFNAAEDDIGDWSRGMDILLRLARKRDGDRMRKDAAE